MTREKLLAYAAEQYGTEPEYLWDGDPVSAVLRRRDNRKWYAVMMRVPRERLRLPGEGDADIVNVKTDPLMTGSLLMHEGVLPAYHMNKSCWVSVLLDEAAADAQVCGLLDMSYALTQPKRKKR